MATWQDAYNGSDKVRCDCTLPHVQRSGSQALGLVLDPIRRQLLSLPMVLGGLKK